MKTGIELIAEERREQIEKHGYTVYEDRKRYEDDELIIAAHATITGDVNAFPYGWDKARNQHICDKPLVERLIIAGAFYMAENDLCSNDLCSKGINDLASQIDELLNQSKKEGDKPKNNPNFPTGIFTPKGFEVIPERKIAEGYFNRILAPMKMFSGLSSNGQKVIIDFQVQLEKLVFDSLKKFDNDAI